MRRLDPGKLVIASHNEGKVREISALLGPYGIVPVSAGSLGLPAILFGPSRQDRVHGVDEFIEIDELISACRGYYGIAASALDN